MKKTFVLAVAAATLCIGSHAWAGDVRTTQGAMRKDAPQNVGHGSGVKPGFILAHYYNSAIKRHYRNSSSPAPKAITTRPPVAGPARLPIAHYYNSAWKRHYRNSSSPSPK